MSENIAVVHFDRDGEWDYLASGDLRFIVVDERAPHDRAYEIKGRTDLLKIWELIGEEADIGSCDDDRHQAIAARLTGKPFGVVDGGKE